MTYYDELRKALKDAPVLDGIEVAVDYWKCGEAYCACCGDCLGCYMSDPCYENNEGPHCFPEPEDIND